MLCKIPKSYQSLPTQDFWDLFENSPWILITLWAIKATFIECLLMLGSCVGIFLPLTL